jgi:Ribulose-phosphate 3 epimerase family
MRAARGLDFRIEIDGGISLETIGPAGRAGVQIFVAGSHVFGHGDPAHNVEALQRAAKKPCCSEHERNLFVIVIANQWSRSRNLSSRTVRRCATKLRAKAGGMTMSLFFQRR